MEEFVAAAEAAQPGTPAATWLISFRSNPAALDTAKAVLEASTSTIAQFQAVLVIRDVMVAQWDSLTPEQQGLKSQLLAYLLASYDRCDPVCRAIGVVKSRCARWSLAKCGGREGRRAGTT